MSEDIRAVMARVEKLERQNRLMKIAGLALLTLGGAALLMGQAPRNLDVLETEGLVITDSDGNPRAALAVAEDGSTGLGLSNSEGVLVAMLGIDADGAPSLSFSDQEERVRASFSVEANGMPSLVLFDEDEVSRIGLASASGGRHALQIAGKDGEPAVVLVC